MTKADRAMRKRLRQHARPARRAAANARRQAVHSEAATRALVKTESKKALALIKESGRPEPIALSTGRRKDRAAWLVAGVAGSVGSPVDTVSVTRSVYLLSNGRFYVISRSGETPVRRLRADEVSSVLSGLRSFIKKNSPTTDG